MAEKFFQKFLEIPRTKHPEQVEVYERTFSFIQLNQSFIKYFPIVVKSTSHCGRYAKTHFAEREITTVNIRLPLIRR